MSIYSFPKKEHLCNQKSFEALFRAGKSFVIFPFRIIWKTYPSKCDENTSTILMGVSVPKKHIKKAVIRNKIKRRIRESYRKNKRLLWDYFNERGEQCHILVIFVEKKEVDYHFTEEKIIEALLRLIQDHAKITGQHTNNIG